jgi:hypothetical protein
MLSPPHWQKIMAKDATEIGLGVFRSKSGKYYACLVLGSRSPQSPVLTVPPAWSQMPSGSNNLKLPTYYPSQPSKEGFQFGIGSLPVAPQIPETYYTPPAGSFYSW